MDIIQGILSNLIKEKDAYAQMLEISKEKQECILQDNLQGLNAMLQKEQVLVKSIAALEKERDALTLQLSRATCIAPDELTVEAIAGQAQEETARALRKAKNQFATILTQQMAINETNQKLLETQLSFVNFMINTLTRQPDVGNMYSTGGLERQETPTHIGIIDQEI